MHALLAKWAPPEERSKLGAFIYAGKLLVYPQVVAVSDKKSYITVF